MDTKKDSLLTAADRIRPPKSCRLIVGTKQIRKAMEQGRASRVFLARNADPAITAPLEDACRKRGIPCFFVRSMAELGQICGIEVGAAAAAWSS